MDHPPYEPFHFQWETAWILTLLLACLAMFITRSRYTLLCVVFFSYLMTYRFMLESLGGAFLYPL